MASTAAIHRPLAFQMKCSEPNGRALRVRIPVSFLYIHSKRPPNALAIPKVCKSSRKAPSLIITSFWSLAMSLARSCVSPEAQRRP